MLNWNQNHFLLTGATGFLGRNLSKQLIHHGAKISAICRPSSDLSKLPEGTQSIIDHGSTLELVKSVEKQPISAVIHLAAEFVGSHTPDHIDSLISANIGFATRIFELAYRLNSPIINTGTYAEHYENEPYFPINLYAASKHAAQNILDYYTKVEGIPSMTLKLFDIYGPHDTRPKILNFLQKIAKSGEELEMTEGKQLFDLVHISDVCNAYEVALQKLLFQKKIGIYGISSGERKTLKEVVMLFEKVCQVSCNIKWGAKPYRKREVMIPWETFQPLEGWKPQLSLEEGFKNIKMLKSS